MSETKKMTKQEILEIFKGEYKSVLRKYERKVETYTIEMNEDYEYFFRWHSDGMYKAQVNLKAVRELRPIISLDDLDKIKTCLCNHIGNIEHTLIEGSQTTSSINIMMNAAEVLKRVAMQEMRGDLQRLLGSITCNE